MGTFISMSKPGLAAKGSILILKEKQPLWMDDSTASLRNERSSHPFVFCIVSPMSLSRLSETCYPSALQLVSRRPVGNYYSFLELSIYPISVGLRMTSKYLFFPSWAKRYRAVIIPKSAVLHTDHLARPRIGEQLLA